jgi:hypothetical protein
VQRLQLFSFRETAQTGEEEKAILNVLIVRDRPPLAAAGIEEAIAAEIPLVVW